MGFPTTPARGGAVVMKAQREEAWQCPRIAIFDARAGCRTIGPANRLSIYQVKGGDSPPRRYRRLAPLDLIKRHQLHDEAKSPARRGDGMPAGTDPEEVRWRSPGLFAT